MTTIHSTVSDKTLDIIQDLFGLDEAVVRIGESVVICVKTADLRAAVNAIDPEAPAKEAFAEEEVDWRDSDRVEVDGIEGIEGRIVVGRETAGERAGRWVFPSGFHYGDDAVATLNPKAVSALTRRHEQDQERIRELEADVSRARSAVQVQVQRVKELAEPKTAREHLEMAWDAAQVPADGMIHKGEEVVARKGDTIRQGLSPSRHTLSADVYGTERRLLDPRPELTEEEVAAKELYADIKTDLELDEDDDGIRHLAGLLVRIGWRKGGDER